MKGSVRAAIGWPNLLRTGAARLVTEGTSGARLLQQALGEDAVQPARLQSIRRGSSHVAEHGQKARLHVGGLAGEDGEAGRGGQQGKGDPAGTLSPIGAGLSAWATTTIRTPSRTASCTACHDACASPHQG